MLRPLKIDAQGMANTHSGLRGFVDADVLIPAEGCYDVRRWGKNGMRLALALEDAKDAKVLLAAVQRVQVILRHSRGPHIAEQVLLKIAG
jgi:hypothetical protein